MVSRFGRGVINSNIYISQEQKILKFYRFNLKPESGRSKGLTLMLDGHNDIVADSSVPDDFQVCCQKEPRTVRGESFFYGFSGVCGNSRFQNRVPFIN